MHNKIVGNPTVTPMAIPDWNQTDPLKADYIKNKPNYDEAIEKKVDKEEGKGLSTNDFTDEYKDEINNSIKKIFDFPNAGLSVPWTMPYYDYAEDDVQYIFGEDFQIIEHCDADGNFIDVSEFYDTEVVARHFLELDEKINPTPITVVPTTLYPNQQYNFGEVEELALTFPTVANDGDVIYLTFTSGATPTALAIDTTNTCDIEVIPEANTGYEIFGKYNGSIWIVNYSEYTVSEV